MACSPGRIEQQLQRQGNFAGPVLDRNALVSLGPDVGGRIIEAGVVGEQVEPVGPDPLPIGIGKPKSYVRRFATFLVHVPAVTRRKVRAGGAALFHEDDRVEIGLTRIADVETYPSLFPLASRQARYSGGTAQWTGQGHRGYHRQVTDGRLSARASVHARPVARSISSLPRVDRGL